MTGSLGVATSGDYMGVTGTFGVGAGILPLALEYSYSKTDIKPISNLAKYTTVLRQAKETLSGQIKSINKELTKLNKAKRETQENIKVAKNQISQFKSSDYYKGKYGDLHKKWSKDALKENTTELNKIEAKIEAKENSLKELKSIDKMLTEKLN